jgi:hypothetical protein
MALVNALLHPSNHTSSYHLPSTLPPQRKHLYLSSSYFPSHKCLPQLPRTVLLQVPAGLSATEQVAHADPCAGSLPPSPLRRHSRISECKLLHLRARAQPCPLLALSERPARGCAAGYGRRLRCCMCTLHVHGAACAPKALSLAEGHRPLSASWLPRWPPSTIPH